MAVVHWLTRLLASQILFFRHTISLANAYKGHTTVGNKGYDPDSVVSQLMFNKLDL